MAFSICSSILFSTIPASAVAQEKMELTANRGAVSDYRFRGISLSDWSPAVQTGVDVTDNGFFAGTWGSTIVE